MRFLPRPALLLASVAMLAACETHNPTVTPVATEPDIVTVKLSQAADKASAALDSIAGIEQARNPGLQVPDDYANAPPALMQPVSLRWSGPVEKVVQALAERGGMRFRIKGSLPPVPVIVNVDAYQQPILHILRDIGLQAGHRATIAVSGASGVVELQYNPADQSR